MIPSVRPERISVTITAHGGEDFPEAEYYDEYVFRRLSNEYPNAEIDVSIGIGVRVFARDEIVEDIKRSVKVDYWNDFCEFDWADYCDDEGDSK
jgi:hypothetical protein